MAEETNASVDSLILDKKLQNYGKNQDFVAPRELTVTITLAEYRSLVESDAKSRASIEEERSAKWKLQSQVNELQKQIEAFRTICPAVQVPKPSTENTDDTQGDE